MICRTEEEIDRRTEKNHDIGWAVYQLKYGKFVTRRGWNGKGMFLWLKPAVTVMADWCHDPILKGLCEVNGGSVEATGTVCMYTADHKVLTGWLASQTDLLALDWEIATDVPEGIRNQI